MAGGTWRQITCELDGCLEIFHGQNDDDLEPLIVDGCTKEIPFLDFSSIVLPKEAFFTSENGSVKSRGRGRSLTNRALGFDKPCRRPGQRATLDKAGSMIKNAESKTLGSQFFGSEYLYEEMFPSLDQSSSVKSDIKPGGQDGTKKTRKETYLSSRKSEEAKNKESGGKSTPDKFSSESSNVLRNSISNENEKFTPLENFKDKPDESNVGDIVRNSSGGIKSPSLMTINKNKTEVFETVSEKFSGKPRLDLNTNPDILKEHDIVEEISDKDSRTIDSEFNKAEFEMVQSSSLESINNTDCSTTKASEDSFEHLSEKMEIENHENLNPEDDFQEACQTESKNENKLFSPHNNNQVESNDQFADQLRDQDYDEQNLSLKANIQSEDIEPDDNSLQKWNDEEDKNSDDVSDQEKHNPKDSQNTDSLIKSDNSSEMLKENDSTCDVVSASSNKETLKASSEENHFLPVEDTIIATSENSSLSQSSVEGPHCEETTDAEEYLDMEIKPCNVLLENLPFALTEEELQDIIEPYGEIESYNFINKGDDSNKTCSIRMPNSLSGELLVISVDGLEVHGCRIKATMEDV